MTFMVWGLVLVPIIYTVLPAHRRTQFTALNTSSLLINLHVVNLAITILDFTAAPRRLNPVDFYIAVRSRQHKEFGGTNYRSIWFIG